jgi:hemerythrin
MANTLSWSPELSVGIEVFDADHKAFFELAFLLQDASGASVVERAMIVGSAIGLLEEYVDGHFLREEKAMKKANFPHFPEHIHKHKVFRGRIREIAKAYRDGATSIADDIPSLVSAWLTNHIMQDDQKYKNWVRASMVDDRPLAFLAIEAEDNHP